MASILADGGGGEEKQAPKGRRSQPSIAARDANCVRRTSAQDAVYYEPGGFEKIADSPACIDIVRRIPL